MLLNIALLVVVLQVSTHNNNYVQTLCIPYFYLILLLSVILSVISMYINFILDVELS